MSYLDNNLMHATCMSLSLAASVLKFDIAELWQCQNGKYKCEYRYASEQIRAVYSDVVVGRYPSTNMLPSDQLCAEAQVNPDRIVWKLSETQQVACHDAATPLLPSFLSIAEVCMATQMAMLLDPADTNGLPIFIVGYSIVNKVLFSSANIKFLAGLGYAIYIAAFDLDEGSPGKPDIPSRQAEPNDEPPRSKQLDQKHTVARGPLQGFRLDLGSSGPKDDASQASQGVWRPGVYNDDMHLTPRGTREALVSVDQTLLTRTEPAADSQPSTPTETVHGFSATDCSSAETSSGSQVAGSSGASDDLPSRPLGTRTRSHDDNEAPQRKPDQPKAHRSHKARVVLPPTWSPEHAFSFPIAQLPVKVRIRDDFKLADFSDVQLLDNGNHSNLFVARLPEFGSVVIKMLGEHVQDSIAAQREFDIEHGILARVSHPNIIRILGAGSHPRRFIVLENLEGGSLLELLGKQTNPGFAQQLFRRPTFTYPQLLTRAREVASAMQYLHEECQFGAAIIHRDLKPDNIRFAADGTLKLFDFGLSTCVLRRTTINQSYKMTGQTGSLRYMAPEVARLEPYSEKVDVYSFGILLWQMAKDKLPFHGMTKEEFIEFVVVNHQRPKIDKSWPQPLSNLLVSCWSLSPSERPPFSAIVTLLDELLAESEQKAKRENVSGLSSVFAAKRLTFGWT